MSNMMIFTTGRVRDIGYQGGLYDIGFHLGHGFGAIVNSVNAISTNLIADSAVVNFQETSICLSTI